MQTKNPILAPSTRTRIALLIVMQLVVAATAEAVLGVIDARVSGLARITRALSVFLVTYVVHLFATRSLNAYRVISLRNLLCFYTVLALTIVCIGVSQILALGLASFAEKQVADSRLTAGIFFFAIPFGVGVLMLQTILGRHSSLVQSILLAFIVALYYPTQGLAFPYVLCTLLIGALSLLRFRTRAAYLRSGLFIGIVGLPFTLAAMILSPDIDLSSGLALVLAPFFGGIISAFLAAGLTPIVEYLGGYATDMRLIEMATLDHPLLKELSIQAPGTWNHSMVMGMMVESAADAIGANSVICRVGAYFHDIGKIKKPLYFVENQEPGENRHDKLSPSMSALIIRSHVKDGVELAIKHGVPQVIQDMVPQHHGTSLIEFFFDKAREEATEAGEDPDSVDRSLYSYPGPQPQTREAGILMLADGIEAATRTLQEPSFDRIQGLVQKMINKVFASGQLNECELTLKDLHKIAKCFTRVLTGIYHQRIAYAEPVEKSNDRSGAKSDQEEGEDSSSAEVEGATTSKKQKAQNEERESEKEGEEDLKRLGL